MLEYGWLWYYSRMWWTDAKNRSQRRRLRVLSKSQTEPPRTAAHTSVAEVCTTGAEAGGADARVAYPEEQRV
jgi:hypothetical protein